MNAFYKLCVELAEFSDDDLDLVRESLTEAPAFEDAAISLLKVVNRLLRTLDRAHPLYQQLYDAAANVEAFEQNDDPIRNGWLGSDGLP